MKIYSVREVPEQADVFIRTFQKYWASPDSMAVYDDAIRHTLGTESRLPQWYLLVNADSFDGANVIGCAGLIPNDFISRCDLYPWLCALLIDPDFRGHNYGSLLIHRCLKDAGEAGYPNLYIATDHIGYYEHFGFEYIGTGYHPWGETSRIYARSTEF